MSAGSHLIRGPYLSARCRLDLCFQRALGDLSFFFSLAQVWSKGREARKKYGFWKPILIRRRSAGTEAGRDELFTSSELCQR